MTYDEFCAKAEAIAPGCAVEPHASGELVIYTGYCLDADDNLVLMTQEQINEGAS